MRLFRRHPDTDLARAVAQRGVYTTARIDGVRETGATREDANELEFRLSWTAESGERLEATVRQFVNDLVRTGLDAGEPASIAYDREDPTKVIVLGSPNYAIVEPGVVVPVARHS